MKTFQFLAIITAFSLSIASCNKSEEKEKLGLDTGTDAQAQCNRADGRDDEDGPSGGPVGTLVAGDQNLIPTNITFCSSKTVALCTKQGSIGNVFVKRGSDNKIYITYTTTGTWYMTEMNLYTGTSNAIPVTQREPKICSFPFRKSFSAPYKQSYTFVLSNMPASFTVAAHAEVVKKSNGRYTNNQDVWGDGCNGDRIYDGGHNGCNSNDFDNNDCKGGNWGTQFVFAGAACPVVTPPPTGTGTPAGSPASSTSATEPDICSKAPSCFFGIHPVYGVVTAWSEATVTVAGFTYTEAEARAIADAPDANNVAADSKFAFERVATLKLSYTDYTLSPSLAPAVTTIETWLATKGKLSPTNLPTGNNAVKTAATTIDTWINTHNCPERR